MPRRPRAGNPHQAIGYLRASTSDQKNSPEVQRAAIEAWAKGAGVVVVAWHGDQGVSGGAELEDRPGLLAAVADLRVYGAGVLAVARRDRLARDPVVAGLIDRAVAKQGAVVAASDGAGNGSDPASTFMRTVVDAAAAYERALIRTRTRAALAAKKARGEKLGGDVPYGFRLAEDGRHLIPHPGEQRVIAEVIALRRAGHTLRSIVRELAAAGVVNRAGRPLPLVTVARLAQLTTTPLPVPVHSKVA